MDEQRPGEGHGAGFTPIVSIPMIVDHGRRSFLRALVIPHNTPFSTPPILCPRVVECTTNARTKRRRTRPSKRYRPPRKGDPPDPRAADGHLRVALLDAGGKGREREREVREGARAGLLHDGRGGDQVWAGRHRCGSAAAGGGEEEVAAVDCGGTVRCRCVDCMRPASCQCSHVDRWTGHRRVRLSTVFVHLATLDYARQLSMRQPYATCGPCVVPESLSQLTCVGAAAAKRDWQRGSKT